MTAAVHPLLERLPLAFHDQRARLERDPDRLAACLAEAMPLAEIQRHSVEGPFGHRSAAVVVGALTIAAACHSPLVLKSHAHPSLVFSTLLFGEAQVRAGGAAHLCRAGVSSLLMPAEDPVVVETGLCSTVGFSVAPSRLQAVATAMAGGGPDGAGLDPARLRQPQLLLHSDPRQAHLLALLQRSLRLIDRLGTAGAPPASLPLDDLLLRNLVLLLQPDLESRAAANPAVGLDELVAAVRRDPLAPWSLTEMERLSGLSRAVLRGAVRSSFGCEPLQWLQRERLLWARRQLRRGEAGVSLPVLAERCGYPSLEAFLAAYRRRCGEEPPG